MYQTPGAFERMQKAPVPDARELVEGAGHWPQQENPETTAAFAAAISEGAGLVKTSRHGYRYCIDKVTLPQRH